MQVDFSAAAGPETEHSLHLPPHAHYDHQASNSSPGYPPFPHPAVPAIDPSLDHSSNAGRNVHARMSAVHPSASPHLLQAENASLSTPHMSHGFYGDMPRSSNTPSTPSVTASPRFQALSPGQPRQIAASFVPNDRALPSRDVSDDTIDDAYAAFILYCNPSFPTSTDTSELTKAFRVPPKSDGNAFSIWALFELIRKFELKEIKTWTQLVLDLGVAPPDIDKGQSTQKVQQYSVRLKRWMRAMHIDAFFEYLLGKQHAYYLQIPPPHNPFPENGRDGVPLEEDLAIRALDPKFRPKRGRRKADDGDDDLDSVDQTPPRKRPLLDTSIPFGNALPPQSAYPNSAHPDDMDRFLSAHDPWTATSAITPASAMTTASAPSRLNPHSKMLTPYTSTPMSAGQQLRWRLNTQDNPSTPHPLSAITPQSAHPDYFDEPQSATTPSASKARSRRRHGPAVSSAWPSNSASSTGKLRGRPPSNRSVRDGPFVTFPANPKTKEGPTIEMSRNTGTLTPIVERAQSDPPEQHFRFPPTPASAISTTSLQEPLQHQPQRPSRLSLQVPQHVGGPVRLVTPTVLVTGEQENTPSTGIAYSAISTESARATPSNFFEDEPETVSTVQQPMSAPARPQTTSLPSIPQETLQRALAAALLRAPLSGRKKRLRGSEAKNLASAILSPLYNTTPNSGKAMSKDMLSIAISSCLGLTPQLGLGHGGPTGGVKKVVCSRYRVGRDGYDSPIEEDEEEVEDSVRETFDVSFNVSFGGLSGEWRVSSVASSEERGKGGGGEGARAGGEEEDLPNTQDTVVCWRTKFLEAQRRLWEREEEVRGLREKVLEAVL